MAQRVDADARGALPLVACGSRVLWLAGQALEPPFRPRG